MSQPTPTSVSVACFGREVWIRIEGRGNFQGCPALRKFTEAMIARGYRDFSLDLAACEHMDSTFMGTLAGISQQLRTLGGGTLRTLNVSPRNADLFENLGLNHLFAVEPSGPEPVMPSVAGAKLLPLPCDSGTTGDRELVLAAHEALVAANPENADRFRDVLDYLKGN
jgi:anti-sigma B factor antagonist